VKSAGRVKAIVVSRVRFGANVMNVLCLMVVVLVILFSIGLDGWATIYERKNGGFG
jgi:regulator of RNase E activity RraB